MNKIDFKQYKNIGFFKGWVLTNFPYIEEDFDALTNYELFCKVVEYLNKLIYNDNATQENVTNLYNYVENLDLQEYVNNKLDQMAESGELAEIISAYLNSKAIFGYDNVDAMKSATNLIEGSFAKTLGYHSINDGGSGLYKIISNENITIDEGSYISLNESLCAQLIEIIPNVKQFGAIGNQNADDTNAFKNAINFVKDGTLRIPNGKYRITDTLHILDSISIIGYENVPTLYFDGVGSLFEVEGHLFNTEDRNSSVVKNEKKPLFSQITMWALGEYVNNFYGVLNTTAITYLSDSNKTTARSIIKNVSFQHFDTCIEWSNIHCYMLEYDNCSFTRSNVAVLTPTNPQDSGERMTFNNCIFDNNQIVMKFMAQGYDCHFLNCSIDFNTLFMYSDQILGSRMIDLNGCHYETKYTGDDTIMHGFLWGVMPQTMITITNSMLLTKVTERQFNKNGKQGKCTLCISNSRIMYFDEDYYTYNINHLFFGNIEDIIIYNNNEQGYADMGLPFNFTNSLTQFPAFNNLATGTATVQNYILTDSANKTSIYTVTGATNIKSYTINSAYPQTNFQSLMVEPNDTSSECILNLRNNEYLDYKNLYYVAMACKNVTAFRYQAIYYDADKKVITTDPFTLVDLSTVPKDQVCIIPRGYRANKSLSLLNAKYIRFNIQIRNGSNTTWNPELLCFMPYII